MTYQCDVTYGTGTEMGFDFLRDRLRSGPRVAVAELLNGRGFAETSVQRGHYFALVDEADHLLIDDATTPLLIALETEEPESRKAMYTWANAAAAKLQPNVDFQFDPERPADLYSPILVDCYIRWSTSRPATSVGNGGIGLMRGYGSQVAPSGKEDSRHTEPHQGEDCNGQSDRANPSLLGVVR